MFLLQFWSLQLQNSRLQGRDGDTLPSPSTSGIPDYHSLTSVFNSCLAKHNLISIKPPRRAARLDLMTSGNVESTLPLEFIPKTKLFTDRIYAAFLLEIAGL